LNPRLQNSFDCLDRRGCDFFEQDLFFFAAAGFFAGVFLYRFMVVYHSRSAGVSERFFLRSKYTFPAFETRFPGNRAFRWLSLDVTE
jgi:hypothetical protein